MFDTATLSQEKGKLTHGKWQEASAPVLAKLTRCRVMRSWKFLSPSERGFPKTNSSPPKKATTSRKWKEKRLGNGSRSLDVLTGPDGVCVTTYRYTGLSRATAGGERFYQINSTVSERQNDSLISIKTNTA